MPKKNMIVAVSSDFNIFNSICDISGYKKSSDTTDTKITSSQVSTTELWQSDPINEILPHDITDDRINDICSGQIYTYKNIGCFAFYSSGINYSIILFIHERLSYPDHFYEGIVYNSEKHPVKVNEEMGAVVFQNLQISKELVL